jgi:menaquinol-cytochrome c reductase iron-sulfur subunit
MSETKPEPDTQAGERVVETTPASPPHEAPALDTQVVARRRFLARVSVGLGAVGGVALGAPLVGFVVAPLGRAVPRTFRTVGKVSDFEVGQTVEVKFVDTSPLPWAGVTANTGAWLRRVDESRFVAFAINCAHLGCPVRWLPDARLFMCPCHGGVYYEDGSVAAGPPPHALSEYVVRVQGDEVQIRAEPIPME